MVEQDESADVVSASDYENLTFIIAVIGVVSAFLMFFILLWVEWGKSDWSSIVFKHFPVTIGLPAAGLASFVVVALFRTTEGKIKFSGLSFHFEGASGPIVMWVMCVLTIIMGIKVLWSA